jgi:D-arabinitol dehydrogenase (NADP+)
MGSFAQAFEFRRAIDLLRAGRIDVDGIITHRFGLDDYGAALESLRSPHALKAVVDPSL